MSNQHPIETSKAVPPQSRKPLHGLPGRLRPYYGDLLAGLLLAILCCAGSYQVARRTNSVIFLRGNMRPDGIGLKTKDIWFDADFPDKLDMLNDRRADQHPFSARHPLYQGFLFAMGQLLKTLTMKGTVPLRTFTTLMAFLWGGALFGFLRLITSRLDAVLITLLGMTSASGLFFLGLPETFTLSSVTIIAALILAVIRDRQPVPAAIPILVSAGTLSVTVTNWMAGIFATVVRTPWKRGLQQTAYAFGLVSVLWGVQKTIVPHAQYFLVFHSNENQFILRPQAGGPLRVASSFFYHTMVMPAIQILHQDAPRWYGMSVQSSTPGSATWWGFGGAISWTVLLALGIYATISMEEMPILRTILASTLLGQLTLHLFWGYETFLYSMHYVPLLIGVVAVGTRTPLRKWILIQVTMVVVCNGVNNTIQLLKAIRFVDEVARLAAR